MLKRMAIAAAAVALLTGGYSFAADSAAPAAPGEADAVIACCGGGWGGGWGGGGRGGPGWRNGNGNGGGGCWGGGYCGGGYYQGGPN